MSAQRDDLKQDMKKIKETVTGGEKGGGEKDDETYYSYSGEEVELQEEPEETRGEKPEQEKAEKTREEEERSAENQGYGGHEDSEPEETGEPEETEETPSKEHEKSSMEESSENTDKPNDEAEKKVDEKDESEQDKGYVETSSSTQKSEKSMMDEIPEAPETKKIEVPEIETGPLFIRVEKFKRAKKKVQEMHEMDDELKTKMAGLKSTLEEDKEINKSVFEVLRDLQESMNSIKEIVSPKKS